MCPSHIILSPDRYPKDAGRYDAAAQVGKEIPLLCAWPSGL